jgi:molybdenum cofactor biosynthesis enzyme MoaA
VLTRALVHLNNASFLNLSNLTQNLSNSYWNSTHLVQLSTTNACITNVSCAMGSFTNMSCVNVSIGTLNNVSFINLSNLTQNLSNSYWNSTHLVQLSTTNACITNVSCAMGSFTNMSCVNVSIGTLNNVSFINLSNLTHNLSYNYWNNTQSVQISTTNACITNVSCAMGISRHMC